MIRFHMMHYQIVRLGLSQLPFQLVQPFMGKMLVHRVHNGNFVVLDHIRIVGHAVGHRILALKQVQLMVIHADVADILGNKHRVLLSKK